MKKCLKTTERSLLSRTLLMLAMASLALLGSCAAKDLSAGRRATSANLAPDTNFSFQGTVLPRKPILSMVIPNRVVLKKDRPAKEIEAAVREVLGLAKISRIDEVTATKGRVTLSGEVSDPIVKGNLLKVVGNLKGVTSIEDKISVAAASPAPFPAQPERRVDKLFERPLIPVLIGLLVLAVLWGLIAYRQNKLAKARKVKYFKAEKGENSRKTA
ncbi:MAG: BON domain-containing protein [Bacteriovoracia bacterium]